MVGITIGSAMIVVCNRIAAVVIFFFTRRRKRKEERDATSIRSPGSVRSSRSRRSIRSTHSHGSVRSSRSPGSISSPHMDTTSIRSPGSVRSTRSYGSIRSSRSHGNTNSPHIDVRGIRSPGSLRSCRSHGSVRSPHFPGNTSSPRMDATSIRSPGSASSHSRGAVPASVAHGQIPVNQRHSSRDVTPDNRNNRSNSGAAGPPITAQDIPYEDSPPASVDGDRAITNGGHYTSIIRDDMDDSYLEEGRGEQAIEEGYESSNSEPHERVEYEQRLEDTQQRIEDDDGESYQAEESEYDDIAGSQTDDRLHQYNADKVIIV